MDRAAITREILTLHRSGASLNISAVRRSHLALLDAAFAIRPFLGWKQALETAGLGYDRIATEIETRIECPVCGKSFQRLPLHLKTHGMTSSDFKEAYPDHELVAEAIRPICATSSEMPHWEPVWSREYILDRTWQWYVRLGTCNLATMQKHDDPILAVACPAPTSFQQRWHRWDDVLADLGLDPLAVGRQRPRRYPTSASVIEAIRGHHCSGSGLSTTDILREDNTLVTSARDFFPSWKDAVAAAGFDPVAVGCQPPVIYPDPASVIAALQARHQAGFHLSSAAAAKDDPSIAPSARKHFGSWTAAIRAAGLLPEHIRQTSPNRLKASPDLQPFHYPTPKSVLAAIRAHHEAGHSLLLDQVNVINPEIVRCYRRVYLKSLPDSPSFAWRQFLGCAGLEKIHETQAADTYRTSGKRWPTPEITLAGVREVLASGYVDSMTLRARGGESASLVAACKRHFGSWKAALQRIDVTPVRKNPPKKDLPPGEVLDRLRNLHASGVSLASTTFGRGGGPNRYLYRQGIRHFGSWPATLIALGPGYLKRSSTPRPAE